MEFEYDPAKSTTNLLKHGIDFEEAQSLWEDQNLVDFPLIMAEKNAGVLYRTTLGADGLRSAQHGATTRESFQYVGQPEKRLRFMTRKTMTDEEFDEYFDNGGDITPFIVEDSVEFPNRNDKARKVNISMPEWMIEELDATARHFATTRQGVINMWIGERLENERRKTMA